MWIEHALYAIDKFWDVEIDQKAGRASCQLEVCQDLGLMHREQPLDGLDLDDDKILDDQIDAIARVEGDSLIDNRYNPLNDIPQAARCQLVLEAWHIRRLQQPRTENPMDLDRGANDFASDGVEGRIDKHGPR